MNSTYTEIKVASIGILSVLDIVTNSIVIAVIVKYPQLREDRTNLFMLSLMVSDIAYGILFMPLSAWLCTNARESTLDVMSTLTDIHMVFGRLFATTSFSSLAWVTVCKMVAITKPFIYERYLANSGCYIIIALIWSLGIMIGTASLWVDTVWSPELCMSFIARSSVANAIPGITFMIVISISVILIVYGTAKIFMVIVRTHREITSQVQSIGGEQSTHGQTTSATLQSIRSGKIVLIICASAVLISTPSILHGIYSSIFVTRDEHHNMVKFCLVWSAPCNSVANSFLFVFLFRSVRSKTVEMMKGACKCITRCGQH